MALLSEQQKLVLAAVMVLKTSDAERVAYVLSLPLSDAKTLLADLECAGLIDSNGAL
jgi:hypothetical protein